jgi:membrane protein implicated in regulation of membrane protease activity
MQVSDGYKHYGWIAALVFAIVFLVFYGWSAYLIGSGPQGTAVEITAYVMTILFGIAAVVSYAIWYRAQHVQVSTGALCGNYAVSQDKLGGHWGVARRNM